MFVFLASVILCGVALLFIYLMARHVELGLFILLSANFINITFGLNATSFGRLHLSLLDGVYIGLLFAGAFRFVHGLRSINTLRAIALCYLLIFGFTLVRGFNLNGIFAAANEARGFVGPMLALLYFIDAPVDEKSLRRYVQGFLLFGAALCVVAVLAATGLPVGVSEWAHSAPAADDNRYLPASAGAALGICGFLALARSMYQVHGFLTDLQAPVFFLVAVYLRHRTVWMMLLAGIGSLLFIDGRLFRRALLSGSFALAAIVGIALYTEGDRRFAGESDFSASASNADTWHWRVIGWQEFLFDSNQTPTTVLFGSPIGSGWWRIDPESHLTQNAPPHSEYVTEYLRMGMVGLFVLTFFLLGPFIALYRTRNERFLAIYPSPSIWLVVIFSILIYGVTYSIEPESYALLGIAASVSARTKTARESSASEELDSRSLDSSLDFAR